MTNENILLTYIIVTWNNEKEIQNCIDSIVMYTKGSYEICIVDNDSKDKTVDIIKRCYPLIQLVESKQNLGFAEANNVALRIAKGEYVCFINPDIVLVEDISMPSIAVMKSNQNIGVTSVRLCNADMSWQPSCFRFAHGISLFTEIMHIDRLISRRNNGKNSYYPDWVIGAEMIMRTRDAIAVGGFSTEYYMYSEDMDLCKKVLMTLQKKVYYLANIKMIHLGGSSEIQNVMYSKQLKMFCGKIHFNSKFYGDADAKNACNIMRFAYNVRLACLKVAYWRADRSIQIDKTLHGKKCIEEVVNQWPL